MSTGELLAALEQALAAALEWRRSTMQQAAREIVSQAAAAGRLNSSATTHQLARAYQDEARACAEIVAHELRRQRPSWPLAEIVAAEARLGDVVGAVLQRHLGAMTRVVEEQIPPNRSAPAQAWPHRQLAEAATVAMDLALKQVGAVVIEIGAAARAGLAARSDAERPLYIAHIHAPIGAFVQGGGSAHGAVQQTQSPTPQELAEAVGSLVAALRAAGEEGPATRDLAKAEAELRAGRLPFASLARAIEVAGKIQDLATKAPGAIEASANVIRMLGL